MKKIILLILLSYFLIANAYSQIVIDKPKFGYSNVSELAINKIELTDTTTIIHFHVAFGPGPGSWIYIPDQTFIRSASGGEKLFVRRANGVPLNQRYTLPLSGEISYILTFPKVDHSITAIDFGEGNEEGNWAIFDIQIKLGGQSLIPDVLAGNWFNTETGTWELSLFDNVAVYKNQIWQYGPITLKKGSGSIQIRNKTKAIELFVKDAKNGMYRFGESAKSLTPYNKNMTMLVPQKPVNDKPYELPIFNLDSATYSGYIKGYSPRIGVKSLKVSAKDIITGESNSYLIAISDNGYFSTKVPLYYPQEVVVTSSVFNGTVFLEPGKEAFQLIDQSSNGNGNLFMGDVAKVNSDLLRLQHIYSYNYLWVLSNILNMSPSQYKAHCLDLQGKDMRSLDSIGKASTVSRKAMQIAKLDLEYLYMCNMMEYQWRVESAYREKNQIPEEQRTLPIKIDSLTGDYFNFITNENTNDHLAALSSHYYTFVNRLKYLEIIRGDRNVSYTALDIIDELKKTSYLFTEEEKRMIEYLGPQRELDKKYWRNIAEFYMKYFDKFREVYKPAKETVDIAVVERYLLEKGIEFTNDEKLLLEALKAGNNTLIAEKKRSYQLLNLELWKQFFNKHSSFINDLFTQNKIVTRNENVQKVLGVKQGFNTDLMTSQDRLGRIVAEMSPVSEEEIRKMQLQVSTPFIAEYMSFCNQQIKMKIQSNKSQTGYVVNKLSKSETAGSVFDIIIEKYKGKVVYIDFWATWCGPCRSGIQEIKSLKDEMKGEDVTFVYITNHSSPENTWSNMITDIKGEHYRVTEDEWNYLSSNFNITGIPHYVLVGKNGDVINPNLPHLNNEALKNELQKHLK